jgi:GT2 family glycosyltransferase
LALRRIGADETNRVLLDTEAPCSAAASGGAAAHNRLMRKAFEEGADLYVATDAAGALHPDAVAALASMSCAGGGRFLLEADCLSRPHAKPVDPFSGDIDWSDGFCLALSRLIFTVAGGFDEAFAMPFAAIDLSWRARAFGLGVRACPLAIFLSPAPTASGDRDVGFYRGAVRLARKWWAAELEHAMIVALDALGAQPSDCSPEPVPPEWRHLARTPELIASLSSARSSR